MSCAIQYFSCHFVWGYDDVKSALPYGYYTEELPEGAQNTEGEIIDATDVPNDIKNTTDEILGKVIFDEKNNKKFRYTKRAGFPPATQPCFTHRTL